jgi:uncharacterized membrane protein YphA (DoxX/SURF4 family)
MRVFFGLMFIIFAVWAMIYSGFETHRYQYHYNGSIQAIEKNDVGDTLDTEQNRLAILNNKAGSNNSTWLAFVGGALLAIGLRLYVTGIRDNG